MTPQEVRDIVRAMRFHALDKDGKAYTNVATLGRWLGIFQEHRTDGDEHDPGSGGGYTDADAVKAVKNKLS